MSIQNDVYSVFATAQAIKGPSPDETSELDENPNTIMPSEPREERGHSGLEDVGPVLEATPDSSPRSHPESPSDVDSQTSPEEEESSSDSSDDDSDTFSLGESNNPWYRPNDSVRLPRVNISAFTETGQKESSITVPLQRAYTGNAPVISSELADTPCATLGIRGLLDQLNTTLGTSHSLDTPSLSSLLEGCITNNDDFGMAYSHLRRIWYTRDWSTIRAEVCRWEEEDRKMRQKALVGNLIVNPCLPPRRVWDLYSNRVVPWWSTGIHIENYRRVNPTCSYRNYRPRPISHSWMDDKDRVNARTPINGYEWPVPIPKDANLKLIRIEMLNLGAQYAWLDVLCLRQRGGQREDMRVEEWKLDVPTIGAVYHQSTGRAVIYLSGLGRPLTLKEGDLESDRSWFRRAWTLQELGWPGSRVIAGDTPCGPMHARHTKDGRYETELLTRFHKLLRSIDHGAFNHELWRPLKGMQKRVSTIPVDKVAGLAFGLYSNSIPAYYESRSLEEAWTALVNSMGAERRGVFFVWYPDPGNAGTKWKPSWDQIMTKPLPGGIYARIRVDRNEKTNENSCDAYCIEKGLVRGLDVVEGGDQYGKLIVKDKGGIEHGFKITATHEYPIPEDTYTLILAYKSVSLGMISSRYHCYCVVGRSLPGKRFEKVSVFQILDEGEVGWLRDLDITKRCRYILV